MNPEAPTPPISTGFNKSRELLERASRIIPGGIYGHASPALLGPGPFPAYAASARGCRYTDVDGNELIDFMCAYGPIVLGYQDPEVEEAAARQRERGDCFNHPTERIVELAEALVERIDIADWAVFAKNGADVTGWTLQVARAATGREDIIRIQGGYHGTHPWSNPGHHGWIEDERKHVLSVKWNDAEGLLELARKKAETIAALILSPFHHPVFADSVDPSADFVKAVRTLQERYGILVIIDDIRAGFRLHRGGSHQLYGYEPDMVCFCKALGNGHPISAAVGRSAFKIAASKVFLTGSYWNSAVPMAAALKCLEILDRDQIPARLEQTGLRLREGLKQLGQRYGREIIASGPPAVPTYRFANDPGFVFFQQFCALAALEGVFFHPHHNWFLCGAHRDSDIAETLAAAERAFRKMAS
jgi:glutamate-1-semialdehyde 2,1-aminomutase